MNDDLKNARRRFFQVFLGGFVIVVLINIFSELLLPYWLFPYAKIGSFLALLYGFSTTFNRWARLSRSNKDKASQAAEHGP